MAGKHVSLFKLRRWTRQTVVRNAIRELSKVVAEAAAPLHVVLDKDDCLVHRWYPLGARATLKSFLHTRIRPL